ncbi:30S ribosomal protein S14 [Candidatus Symbiobacter mobilis]|uniref:Small ribosomal subunit protein uS14 n=1 Tax=Candidatus Symbiobacter mobilis CR TaxID=946483 RepID=U5N7V6_9BURK|nr:30S ribosomal protein S14 [Candidatus Symbiobacter mobilis]AGX86333.1 ribosomal protein S14 [Candidatus Symbiobacter mobilis CR]
MAKKSLIERELKRDRLVAKFSKKYAEWKQILSDTSQSEENQLKARSALQQMPRNANPTRQRNRCGITGRPRGTFAQFKLARAKIREMAFAGEIPGMIKASW